MGASEDRFLTSPLFSGIFHVSLDEYWVYQWQQSAKAKQRELIDGFEAAPRLGRFGH